MFPMTRIVYSIASDGLIFKWLAKILPKVQTPGLATICAGLITAILATLFDLDQLIEMTSIGTLLSYSIVSACVIVLR
jgi:cationic amino acid transporter 3